MAAEVSKANTKDLKQSSSPVANCVMTPTYPIMVAPSPYAVVSPVLLPYVEAPVRFAKGKSKKKKETLVSKSSVNVRYVPAYTYTPLQSPYLCHSGSCLGSPSMSQRLGIPFAMRINPDSSRLNQGYVSALSLPPAYVIDKDSDIVLKSGLNPLSRPYTPPSRLKPCTCGEKSNSVDDVINCEKCQRHDLPSPELCCNSDVLNDDSRVQTPVSSCCSKFSDRSGESSSDVDSGVDGESDELLFEFDKPTSGDDKEENSIEELIDVFNGFDLANGDHVKEELSSQLTRLVDFLCLHLDSYEWRTVARELGVNDVVIQSVEYDFYDSFRDQMEFVFFVWAKSQKSKSFSDSYAMTERALCEIGRQDLVKLLSENKTE